MGDLNAQRRGNLVSALAAVARTAGSNAGAVATSITLNAATKFIEINTIGGGLFVRYQAGCTNANFDEYVSAESCRHYFKPAGCTVISVLGDGGTTTYRIIEKSA